MSLDRLSPVIARPHDQQKSPLDQKVHSQRVPHSHFRMNERVVVHNKQGVGIHGTVKWIEEVSYAGDKLLIVGIETVRYPLSTHNIIMYIYNHTFTLICRILQYNREIL